MRVLEPCKCSPYGGVARAFFAAQAIRLAPVSLQASREQLGEPQPSALRTSHPVIQVAVLTSPGFPLGCERSFHQPGADHDADQIQAKNRTEQRHGVVQTMFRRGMHQSISADATHRSTSRVALVAAAIAATASLVKHKGPYAKGAQRTIRERRK